MSIFNRLMGGTALRSPDGEGGGGGGGSGNPPGDFGTTIATIPEGIRGHEALKDVKDIGGLVKGLVTIATPKPAPAAGSKEAREAFLSMLPEDIRTEATFKDIHDVGGLAKTYHSAAKMVGLDKGQVLRLPSGPDDKEGHAALRTALGVPESVDKYVIPKLGDGKEYSDGDKAFQSMVLPILHKAGVPQSAIDSIVPEWNQHLGKMRADSEAANTAELKRQSEAFKTELGAGYEPTLQLGVDTLAYYAKQAGVGPEVIKELDRDGLGARPGLAKILAHMGKQLQEDGLLGKGGGAGEGGLVPAEAKQKIAAKEGDATFMKKYRNKGEAGHAEAVAEMSALYQQAYPEAPKA